MHGADDAEVVNAIAANPDAQQPLTDAILQTVVLLQQQMQSQQQQMQFLMQAFLPQNGQSFPGSGPGIDDASGQIPFAPAPAVPTAQRASRLLPLRMSHTGLILQDDPTFYDYEQWRKGWEITASLQRVVDYPETRTSQFLKRAYERIFSGHTRGLNSYPGSGTKSAYHRRDHIEYWRLR